VPQRAWQALERQLSDAKRQGTESADALHEKLNQCNQALKRTEQEVIRVRAEHTANAERRAEMSQTREEKLVHDHEARVGALQEQISSLEVNLRQVRSSAACGRAGGRAGGRACCRHCWR